ncbi:MAG: DegV family protein [Anaerolineales bacterium]|nr:DegV family protein [Anaerolineales bacterium]MDW8161064.1 DegV family protein [Anaerolineales bacterium]
MIQIITDTTAVLSKEQIEKHNLIVIPQIIHIDDETYLEGVDIDTPQFLAKLKTTKTLPKTAAPPPELFAKEFARFAHQDVTILCIHPSAEVSGTVRSATLAAQDFPHLDIRIIDTRLIASPLATLVTLAAQWAESGVEADEIVSRIYGLIPRCRIYFMVDTLEYLAKGGRIGGASALLGSVLQIKPILTFKEGRVEVFEKERTHRRAFERLIEIAVEGIERNRECYPTVMHAGAEDQARELAKRVSTQLLIPEIPIYTMPPAIITHGGPGILGIAFFTQASNTSL